jgi:hypothetical protein
VTLPITPVTLPADLVGQPNGRIPGELLVDVGPSGLLHHLAARAWKALVADAASNGLPLTYTYGGTYRTLAAQTVLFESRYSPGGSCGGCKPYKGAQWCKKPDSKTGRCPATAATPGTSNHGLGLAIDTAFDSDVSDGIGPDDAAAIYGHPKWSWFEANVPRYGFSWETVPSEPWHIRYVTGDAIPQAVLNFENPPTEPPKPPKPLKDVDMIALDATFTEPDTVLTWDGLFLAWVENGHAANVIANVGAPRQTVDRVQLAGIVQASRTTTPAPWTLDTELQTLWNSRKL